MAKLREYQPQQTGAGPVDTKQATASDFGLGDVTFAAGKLGQGLSEGADIELQRKKQQEASEGSANMAVFQDTNTTEYSEYLRTAGPNDPDRTEEFTKKYEEGLAKIGEGFTTPEGRQFFEKNKAEMVSGFKKMAIAGQVELARARGGERFQLRMNSFGNEARNNPSALENIAVRADLALEEDIKNGTLTRQDALKLRPQMLSDLTVASMQGQIALDPTEAKRILDSKELDNKIDAGVKNQLYGQLDQEIRGRRAEAAAQRAEFERMRTERQRVTQDKFIKAHAENKLTVRSVLDSDLEATGGGSKDFFIKMIEQEAERKTTNSNPDTVLDVFRRIRMRDGEKGKIYDERELDQLVLDRKITLKDYAMFREEISGSKSEEGRMINDWRNRTMDAVKGKLTQSNPYTGKKDPIGDERFAAFEVWATQTFRDQRAKGVPAQELLDPDSDKWIGKKAYLFKADVNVAARALFGDRSQTQETGPYITPTFNPDGSRIPQSPIEPTTDPTMWQDGDTIETFRARRKKAKGQ
jgi:hypothetical protein